MKKLILIGGLIAAISGGAFLYLSKNTTDTTVPEQKSVFSVTPENIRKGLVGVSITIPNGDDAPAVVVLDQYPVDGEVLLGGSYVDNDSEVPVAVNVVVPEFTATSEDLSGILDVSGADGVFFLAPLYVNFGGTGTFLMIALYEYDATSEKVVHRAMHFIDDRVAFNGFKKNSDGTIELHYLSRIEGEAMSDAPTHQVSRVIRRDGTNINPVQ